MTIVKSYDAKCHDLAKAFLSDEPDLDDEMHAHLLALEIQQVIEDEIYFMRNNPELYPVKP